MAENDVFNIEWTGLEELEKEFDRMTSEFEKILKEEYTKYGMLVEEGSKALAHHKEGDLEDSISFDPAKIEGHSVIVEGGANAKHALRRHEEPGRGEGTLAKSAWRGYQPGPKYMENAIKATEEDYNKLNERILQRVLGEEL